MLHQRRVLTSCIMNHISFHPTGQWRLERIGGLPNLLWRTGVMPYRSDECRRRVRRSRDRRIGLHR